MTRKRQIESNELSSTKKPAKQKPITFDEVAEIIQTGDSDKLREIIESGAVSDINMHQNHGFGSTILMVACEGGFIECARVLLHHNADINYISYDGSVLKSACLSRDSNMLEFIVKHGAVLNDSILLDLFSSGEIVRNTEIATKLVGYIQNVNLEEHRETSLVKVCSTGNTVVLQLLLDRGALFDRQRSHALELAARNGHVAVIKILLGIVANDLPPYKGAIKDALDAAARYNYIEVAKCIIEFGTDLDSLNHALVRTVLRNRLEIAALLLESGANLNTVMPNYASSSWMLACQSTYPHIVQLFLDRGADPNAVGGRGESALHAALPHYDTVMILLRSGADPNIAHAATGDTALMKAALDLNVDLVRLLLEHGADVTQVNREGKSVLDMLGRTRKYCEVRELCTQYMDCNKPGAKLLLK